MLILRISSSEHHPHLQRPSVGSAWEPFYSSSPSFSAHSTTSIVSLQGKTALPGHPKTLRDLSHVTEMLMLPASFGAIQLGETFTSCLSVNNEATVPVDAVTLTVEVQTASMKTVLAEFGGEGQQLAPGDSLEKVVSHEIKELGQHALACTVSYRLPPGTRASTSSDGSDPDVLVFRKFYKFSVSTSLARLHSQLRCGRPKQVTNPLSVKTKVHVPRGPSSTLSRAEREKVFLEIHIQNLTQDAMWLERMHLECADGWQAQDANMMDGEDEIGKESIFSGSMALMQPQDMRQYIYILSPTQLAVFPVSHQPGSIVPLGRLDISWRSSFGEPGRLLTSVRHSSQVDQHHADHGRVDAVASNTSDTSASTGTNTSPQATRIRHTSASPAFSIRRSTCAIASSFASTRPASH